MPHHGMKGFADLDTFCKVASNRNDRFGRLFPELPALYIAPQHLTALGAPGGPMAQTGSAKKTTSVAVGQIFFGQFIDHDLTLDLTSSFARLDDPTGLTNFRTPTFDLDCIYGDGPEGSPFLYWNTGGTGAAFNGIKLLTGADLPSPSAEEQADLVRSPHGTAVIGDPRNDENRIISQLQLAMIRSHNAVADHLVAAGHSPDFEETRRVMTWLYQWVILHDFLPTLVGLPMVADILGSGRKVFATDCEETAFMPVEFSVAAYRFGHSMIPQRVQVQPGGSALDVFGPTLGFGFSPLTDLKAVVDWPQVLDLSVPSADPADQLDAELAADLLNLPFIDPADVNSLATRNLLRGQALRLPSGESVAAACGRDEQEITRVTQAAQSLAGTCTPVADLSAGTPLWLYVLLEAQVIGRETQSGQFDTGEGLGPVGGRIVAETFIGLMELDEHAFLGSNRSWTPSDEGLQVDTLLELLSL